MDGSIVSSLTAVLVNLLLGCFSISTICWTLDGVQSIINNHKREKREAEKAKNDAEYHEKRMQELMKRVN